MHQGACAVREVDLATTLRAFQKLPVGIAVWQLRDVDDVRSLRFVGSNPAAERELRAPVGFAVGKPITQCFPKLLDTRVPEFCRRAVLTGKPGTLGEVAYRDAHIPAGVFWMDCFPLPERCAGIALENITQPKDLVGNQLRALLLLNRITVFLSDAPTALAAAQFCVDEICAQIGWPVGRFFLSDELSPSRFLPNPVWHLSDAPRFRAFRKATEMYELDLSNKLALQHRTTQGKKARLSRSVGFSVVENDSLHGVMEFSSEDLLPLDEHVFRAISNIGFQLGQVFARERLVRQHRRTREKMLAQKAHHDAMFKIFFPGPGSLPGVVGVLESGKRAHRAFAKSSKKLLATTRQTRRHLAELKRLAAKPIEFRPRVES
jgi:hypothetical protein